MSILNFFKKPDLSKMNLQELISQVSPEQAAMLRTMIVSTLLDEKTFNPKNPFFEALRNDKQGNFKILKDELLEHINKLPDNHPAKSLSI